MSRRHPLNAIVADRGGGTQPLLEIAALHFDPTLRGTTRRIGRVCPHAGVTIRLKLQPYGQFIGGRQVHVTGAVASGSRCRAATARGAQVRAPARTPRRSRRRRRSGCAARRRIRDRDRRSDRRDSRTDRWRTAQIRRPIESHHGTTGLSSADTDRRAGRRHVTCVSSITAPTKSTSFSSSGELATVPDVPTASVGAPPPPPPPTKRQKIDTRRPTQNEQQEQTADAEAAGLHADAGTSPHVLDAAAIARRPPHRRSSLLAICSAKSGTIRKPGHSAPCVT